MLISRPGPCVQPWTHTDQDYESGFRGTLQKAAWGFGQGPSSNLVSLMALLSEGPPLALGEPPQQSDDTHPCPQCPGLPVGLPRGCVTSTGMAAEPSPPP